MTCSSALNSRGKPAVSPMSGGPTFDIEKKTRNGANLKLRHALRAGGVIINIIVAITGCDIQRVPKKPLNTLIIYSINNKELKEYIINFLMVPLFLGHPVILIYKFCCSIYY